MYTSCSALFRTATISDSGASTGRWSGHFDILFFGGDHAFNGLAVFERDMQGLCGNDGDDGAPGQSDVACEFRFESQFVGIELSRSRRSGGRRFSVLPDRQRLPQRITTELLLRGHFEARFYLLVGTI